jgi:hypothetical protein
VANRIEKIILTKTPGNVSVGEENPVNQRSHPTMEELDIGSPLSVKARPLRCDRWLLPAKEFRIRILVELNTSECGQQNRENHPDEDFTLRKSILTRPFCVQHLCYMLIKHCTHVLGKGMMAKEFRIRILVELNTSECGQQNRENHPDEDPR